MRPAEASYAYDRVAYEKTRDAYPEGLPALPEIPGGRYYDEQFHALEMEHLWRKTWVVAGHISQLPREGSFITFERLGASVVIVRDKTGDIRAFHNVCRHRGAPLVLESSGRVPRFVCPYHSWSYGLDGGVLAVTCKEDFPAGTRGRSLLPVHCDVWHGMIFINLAENPSMTLAEHMAPLEGQIAGFPLEKLSVKRMRTVYADCNWKAMLDNFYEGYHVATIHQETVAEWLDTKAMAVDIFRNGHNRMCTTRKIFARIKEGISDGVDGQNVAQASMPIVPDFADVFRDHTVGMATFPNNQAALEPGGFPWQAMWPVGPGRTVMDLWILGWDDPEIDPAVENAYWDRYLADNERIVSEDMHLLSAIQKSLEGGAFTGTMMGAQERGIYWYHEEIDRRIGVERIPENLRVEQVLAKHVVPDDMAATAPA
jgi:phenylpropionate dioxygenase-like ring-hydroxylating dioxygenase large terminal subunit